jgi:hypothetical protein
VLHQNQQKENEYEDSNQEQFAGIENVPDRKGRHQIPLMAPFPG